MTAQPYTDQAIFQNSTQTSSLSWSPPLIPLAHFSLRCHPLFANLRLSQNLHISLPAFFTSYSAINSRVGTVVMIIISSELSITHGVSIQKSICGIKWLCGQIGIKMKIHYFLKIVIARYLWLFSRGVSVKTISVYFNSCRIKITRLHLLLGKKYTVFNPPTAVTSVIHCNVPDQHFPLDINQSSWSQRL